MEVDSSVVIDKINEIFRLDKKPEEYFILLCLDAQYYINAAFQIAQGTTSGVAIPFDAVLKRALLANASYIVVAHNHPSRDITPSGADYELTKRLIEVSSLIGIQLLDHIIIGSGKDNYCSVTKAMRERDKKRKKRIISTYRKESVSKKV